MAKNINLTLRGKDKFSPAARTAKTSTEGLTASITKTTAAFAAVALGARAVINTAKEYVSLATKQIEVETKLESVLRSMGGTAGFTAAEMRSMALELQRATTYGDEAIIDLQGTLATFANISGDVFERTTAVALDLSSAFGQDLSSSAVQLGKALDDPMTGLTALRRVGVSFTEDQKAVIASLVKTGDVAGAQGIILEALESQVGGVAEAMGDTAAGALQQFSNAMGDLKEIGGMVILDFIEPAVRGMTTFATLLATALTNAKDLKDALETGNAGNMTAESVEAQIASLEEKLKQAQDKIIQDAIDSFNRLNPGGEWVKDLTGLPVQTQQDVMYDLGSNQEIRELGNQIAQWAQFIPELSNGGGGGGGSTSLADQIIGLRDEAREQINVLREQAGLIHGQELSEEETRKVWISAIEDMVRVLVEDGQDVKNWIGPGTVLEQALEQIATNTDPGKEKDRPKGFEIDPFAKGNTHIMGEGMFGTSGSGRPGMFDGLGEAISSMFSFGEIFASFGGIVETVMGALQGFNVWIWAISEVFKGFMSVVQPMIEAVLEPLSGILQYFGALIGSMLTPVFQLLTPIIQTVAAALMVLLSPIDWLADLLVWFGQKIRYAIGELTFWTKSDNVSDPGRFSSDAFSGLGSRINDIYSTGETSDGGGVGPSINGGNSRVQSVTIEAHVHIAENGIAAFGDESQLTRIGEISAEAIWNFIRSGGTVRWLEA